VELVDFDMVEFDKIDFGMAADRHIVEEFDSNRSDYYYLIYSVEEKVEQ
jgi:hypothetical protein